MLIAVEDVVPVDHPRLNNLHSIQLHFLAIGADIIYMHLNENIETDMQTLPLEQFCTVRNFIVVYIYIFVLVFIFVFVFVFISVFISKYE